MLPQEARAEGHTGCGPRGTAATSGVRRDSRAFLPCQILGRIKAADPKKLIAYEPDSVGRTIIIVHEQVKRELDDENPAPLDLEDGATDFRSLVEWEKRKAKRTILKPKAPPRPHMAQSPIQPLQRH